MKPKISTNGNGTHTAHHVADHEDSLMRTSFFFQALEKTTPMLFVSPDGIITNANEAFLKSYDAKSSDVLHKSYLSLSGDDLLITAEVKRILENAAEGQQIQNPFKRVTSKGKEIWLKCTYTPVFNDEKEHISTLVLLTDISEQKRLEIESYQTTEQMRAQEEELRQNMEELQTTQEATQREMEKGKQLQIELDARMMALNETSLLSESDKFGTITFVNDKFCEVAKYTRDEVMGKPHNILRHPDNPKSFYKDMWDLLKAGKIFRGKFPNRAKDGTDYWVNSTIVPVLDADGVPVKYIGIRQNITEEVAKENEIKGVLSAIDMSFASIQFDKSGNILSANENFLKTVGFGLDEIVGKHHKIFCDPVYALSIEYTKFWAELGQGKTQIGEFKRVKKDGSEVWLQAAYTPITDVKGNVIKVLKIASDITLQKQKNADFEGQIYAINRSNAVIEFNLDGIVIEANDNFLNALGYKLDEIKGKHHSLFCDPVYAKSDEYKQFWQKLNNGEYLSNTYKRFGKGGKEVYIQASYNPIMDLNGKPFKVVKYATDVTAQQMKNADFEGQIFAINKSNAVIEFNLDGTVINANDNFLNALGYKLEEIKGKHHNTFCEPAYAKSDEYKQFWEKLNNGEYFSGTYKRLGKGGKEIYIQASYNPIMNLDGKPFKVVKYATDVTAFTVGFNAATTFINEISKGNFKAEMDLKNNIMTGDIAVVIKDLSSLRDTIKDIVNEINRVVNVAGNEGQLRERLKITGIEGSWKELSESLNLLLGNISEPVLEINKIVTALSMGDLTQSFKMNANGDIKDMADALNIAIKNINKLLKEIEKSSGTVATSSMQMSQKSEGMKKSTKEVASAIQQMASGAQEQAVRTDESSKLVEMILRSANEMGTKADIINNSAEKGQESCQSGLKIIKQLVDNMTGISGSADITSNSIDVLTNRSEEISRTLNVITDIASQTNLLALNAAIEAARAGDAGRGFAVVAEEIRKLAEDSRKSAVDIDRVIKDVQKDVSSANKAIEKMKGSVEVGSVASLQAENVFNEIYKSSAETLSLSKEIQESTAGQKVSIGTVVKNIEKIVVVAEEVASGSQEVASSSLELNKSMEEITLTSDNLSKIAEELKKGVDQFKLTA